MLRAFIAVQLSDNLRRQIGSVQAELKREVSGSARGSKAVKIGWTQPEAIHLTLKFLGDIQEAQVDALRAVLSKAAASARPFTLEARGLGACPNSRSRGGGRAGAGPHRPAEPRGGRVHGVLGGPHQERAASERSRLYNLGGSALRRWSIIRLLLNRPDS